MNLPSELRTKIPTPTFGSIIELVDWIREFVVLIAIDSALQGGRGDEIAGCFCKNKKASRINSQLKFPGKTKKKKKKNSELESIKITVKVMDLHILIYHLLPDEQVLMRCLNTLPQ